jgi:hypothetical protein
MCWATEHAPTHRWPWSPRSSWATPPRTQTRSGAEGAIGGSPCRATFDGGTRVARPSAHTGTAEPGSRLIRAEPVQTPSRRRPADLLVVGHWTRLRCASTLHSGWPYELVGAVFSSSGGRAAASERTARRGGRRDAERGRRPPRLRRKQRCRPAELSPGRALPPSLPPSRPSSLPLLSVARARPSKERAEPARSVWPRLEAAL